MVRNIDYLDMDDRIKTVVGRWWRKWVRPATGRGEEEGGERRKGDDGGMKGGCFEGSGSDVGSGDEADESDEGESGTEVERRAREGMMDEAEEGVVGLMRGL